MRIFFYDKGNWRTEESGSDTVNDITQGQDYCPLASWPIVSENYAYIAFGFEVFANENDDYAFLVTIHDYTTVVFTKGLFNYIELTNMLALHASTLATLEATELEANVPLEKKPVG